MYHARNHMLCISPPIIRSAAPCVLQVFQEEGLIYMVQEYGEIDLARLLAKHDAVRRAAAGSSAGNAALLPDNLDENFIRLYWQQMLQVGARL